MDHKAAGYAASTLLFGEQSISEVDAHTPTSAIPVQDYALDLDTTQVYDLDLALVKGSFSSGASKPFFTIFSTSHLQSNCFRSCTLFLKPNRNGKRRNGSQDMRECQKEFS